MKITKYETFADVLTLFHNSYIPEPMSGCWIWIAVCNQYGYGKLNPKFKKRNLIKEYGAHRFSWSLVNGDIPENKIICHKCDNPSCVNPNHLFVGTMKDNTQDMIKKGRSKLKINKGVKKQKCLKGHDLTDSSNLLYRKSDGSRFCKTCSYIRQKKYKNRNTNEKI